jgi:hypothetical protein
MTLTSLFFGERSLTKVAGLFNDRVRAERAAAALIQFDGFASRQVALLGPTDSPGFDAPTSAKLEPEQGGIWRTLIRAHIATGSIGVAAALLVYAALVVARAPAIVSSPVISLIAILFVGVVLGLMLGGLIALRPDHYLVNGAVRRAIKRHGWVVVAHPVSCAEVRLAINELRAANGRVVRTF